MVQLKSDLRVTAFLTAICVLGSLSLLPTIVAARQRVGESPAGLFELAAEATIQSVVLFAFCAFFGLRAARAASLPGAPFLMRWIGSVEVPPHIRAHRFGLAILLGLVAGAAVFLADLFVFHSGEHEAISIPTAPAIRAFFGNLLSGVIYGGINEEVMMRLFLVSVLVLGLSYVLPRNDAGRAWATGLAIVFVASIFGLAHLPITSTMVEITPMIVVRALILNGIVGVAAGLFYVRNGFEHAVLVHAASHVPIQGGVLMLAQ